MAQNHMTSPNGAPQIKRTVYLSQKVVDNCRISIVVIEFQDGWFHRRVLLPEGVQMSGHSAAEVFYKRDFPFTKIEFNLFGQRRVSELYCEIENPNAHYA